MFLHELQATNEARFGKINAMLKKMHGISLSPNVSLRKLYAERQELIRANRLLQETVSFVHKNSDYTKNLLLIDAIEVLIVEKETHEYDHMFESVLCTLTDYIAQYNDERGELPDVSDVVNLYKITENKQYSLNTIAYIVESFLHDISELDKSTANDGDSVEEDPFKRRGADADTRAAADELYRSRYGDEPLDTFAIDGQKMAAKTYKPSMLNRYRKRVG